MSTPDLARVFTTSHWLVDANGDGYPDGLRPRIVLHADVAPVVAVAAAELAARLGHETMALDLPLVVLDRDLVDRPHNSVLVGASNRWLASSAVAIDPTPDTGLVLALPRGNVAVVGQGEAATAAGLRLLARHLPDLSEGDPLPDLIATVETVCRAQGQTATAVIRRMVIRGDEPRVTELEVVVTVPLGDVDAVATRLTEAAELAWPGAEAMTFSVVGPDRSRVVHRSGAARSARPGLANAALPSAPTLDLARLYSIDGLLWDSDGDFLPDTVRASLDLLSECGPEELAAAGDVAARIALESTGILLPLPGPHSIRIGPVAEGRPACVRITRIAPDAPDLLDVRGAAAARWLARSAPGPADSGDTLVRTVGRISDVLLGRDGPLPAEEIVWDETWTLPWEVDDVRRLVRADVLSHVKPGVSVVLDVRVSEPATVRAELARELTDQLEQRGATAEVTVRNAYKQGFSWLTDEVAPSLNALSDLYEVVVRCRDFRRRPGQEWFSQQALKELDLIDHDAAERLAEKARARSPADLWLDPPIRWLLELYPIDELLPVPRERIRFEITTDQEPTYVVQALGAEGGLLLEETFTATWSERHYLDAYPDLGICHPPTGWFRAEVAGDCLVDQRIATDLERIWDRYQTEILPRLAASVRARAGGPPQPDQQPFFSSFEIHADVSESDDPLPVREERVSALEALHEDLYFVTLEFLKELGRREGGAVLDAPGQVIPWIHDGRGAPPTVRWVLKRFGAGDGSGTSALLPVADAERAICVVGVDIGPDETLARAELRVDLPTPEVLDAARARLAVLPGLPISTRVELHAPGVTPDAVDVARDQALADRDLIAIRTPRGLSREGVIGYDDHLDVLAGLAALPGVRVREAGSSFRGLAGWVVEVVLPGAGAVASHAKQAAWKPTLVINARHHGNEASSTISSLQMVQRLAGDPAWQSYLRRINLIVVPYENLDGATLAWEMQREHPHWMLHAGRFNALGLEMRNAYGDPASPSRESQILPRVWQRWLPDVVVDDHGFPSHEWVQPFSGYVPLWPSYWIPRSLAYAYLRYVEEPEYPEHRSVAERLRDLIVDEVRKDAEIVAWNRDWADRYQKYGHHWLPEVFPVEEYDGLVIYYSRAPVNPAGRWANWGTDFSTLYPQVTAVSFVTEIADETAQGPYMDLCARAHEAIDTACVRLLAEADPRFSRRRVAHRNGVTFWTGRQRPVMPAATAT